MPMQAWILHPLACADSTCRILGRRPCLIPAQGNALGTMNQTNPDSVQRANNSIECRRTIGPLGRPGVFSYSHVPRALPWAGRAAAPLGSSMIQYYRVVQFAFFVVQLTICNIINSPVLTLTLSQRERGLTLPFAARASVSSGGFARRRLRAIGPGLGPRLRRRPWAG
jgi:hypothetical protein